MSASVLFTGRHFERNTVDSTLAQYGLSGVILWLMFKEIIRPIISSVLKKNTDPEKPWNPWQGKMEGRVTRLEDDVSDMKDEQKEQTKLMTKMDKTLYRMSVHMNVPDEE